MKRKLICILLTFPILGIGQSIQKGVVKEYNEAKNKKPIAGVEIKVKNAASEVSRKDGSFELCFRTLKPGDLIEYSKIEKAGYEIFNIDALESWRIANDNTPFTIVLCKSSKFKALKDQYYKEASKSYAVQQTKEEKQLAELLQQGKIQRAEYEKQLTNLRNFYEDQLDNLDAYIDRFARIDLSELSKEEVRIIQMVQDGKIDEAILAYENMHLTEQYAKSVEALRKVDMSVKRLLHEQKTLSQDRRATYAMLTNKHKLMYLQGGLHNIEIIEQDLKTFADQDTTAIDVVYDYARFAYHHMQYNEATKYGLVTWRYYEKQPLSEEATYNKVVVLSLLSIAYEASGDMVTAKEYNRKMEEVIQSESEESSNLRQWALSEFYGYKGWFLFRSSDYRQAISNLKMSYDGYQMMIQTDSIRYCIPFADIAQDLANSYAKENNPEQAYQYYQKSLQLATYAMGIPDVEYKHWMAEAYNGLGDCARLMEDYPSAIAFYHQAISVTEELFQNDEMRFRVPYSQEFSSLAHCYNIIGEMDSALACVNKALNLYEGKDISVLSPVVKECVGAAYMIKGYAYLYSTHNNLALNAFLASDSIIKPLTMEIPYKYSYLYLPLLEGFMMYYYLRQDYERAAQYGKENLEFNLDCYHQYHNSFYANNFCMLAANIGYLLCSIQQYDKSEAIFAHAMDFYNNNDSFQYLFGGMVYARFIANFALLRIQQEQYTEAQKLLDKARLISEAKQQSKTPEDVNIYLNILTFDGLLQLKQGNTEEAVFAWKQVISTNPDFVDRNPDNELYRILLERGIIETK